MAHMTHLKSAVFTQRAQPLQKATRAMLLGVAIAITLSGCGGGGNGNVAETPADAEAQTLLATGRYQVAGSEFMKLAKITKGVEGSEYRASAANAFLLAQNLGGARQALAGVPENGLPAAVGVLANLARARLAADEARIDDAERLLPDRAAIPPSFEPVHTETRIAILTDRGPPLELAKALSSIDRNVSDPNIRTVNQQKLWQALSTVSNADIGANKSPPPDVFGGWLELAELSRLYLADATALNDALELWRTRYPGHPGQMVIAPALLDEANRLSKPATHVALMLPVSGRLARAGAAVRDGFVAAWMHSGLGATTRLSVLDTTDKDVVQVYQSALAAGVDFVVGPLRKSAVTALIESGVVTVPTLALNATNAETIPATLFQLALSPESEAVQVAQKIWFDGHQNALAIGPDNGWGQRVTTAFADAFTALGGTVLETQLYESEAKDLSAPVKRLLNIDQSEQRVRKLRQTVGLEIESEVRRRQDVSAIFMAGFAVQARLLRPQLRFHRATTVPVYSTSHVYGGVASPDSDRDIDGVLFGDMPWVLDETMTGDALRRDLSTHWNEAMAGFSRLFALGADAQALVTRVTRLRAQPGTAYDGYTGTLSVDANNVIVRKLMWAQFADGVPRVVDSESGKIREGQ